MDVLFEANGQQVRIEDILNSLTSVGIRQGDLIFVHPDISVFGKLCIFDRTLFLQNITDAITTSVGRDGTVVMPTFTYSFCKDEIYDPDRSKSAVGVLTDYFRLQNNVVRTLHPIFSVAIWGTLKNELLKIGKDSFDENSIFGKLHKLNGKIIFFGASVHSCTFLHYIEQCYGVPYRYVKTFKGKISVDGNLYDDECTFFVRDLEKNVELDTSRLEKHLIKQKLLKRVSLGHGQISMIPSNALFEEGLKLLDKDVSFFLRRN